MNALNLQCDSAQSVQSLSSQSEQYFVAVDDLSASEQGSEKLADAIERFLKTNEIWA